MILCDTDLRDLMRDGLIKDPDFSLINPASVDIRVGYTAMRECHGGKLEPTYIPPCGMLIDPGEFVLVETYESFRVPNGYAMDLRLKSSVARRGWNHVLAFWVDPGWEGVLTMEVQNMRRHAPLLLKPGDRFAQIIVHQLSGLSASPYTGKYKGARTVEGEK